MKKTWETLWGFYHKVMERTPPLFKITVWLLFVVGFVPFTILNLALWLLGFYQCSHCRGRYHVFTHPKGVDPDEWINVCRDCYPSWRNKKGILRR